MTSARVKACDCGGGWRKVTDGTRQGRAAYVEDKEATRRSRRATTTMDDSGSRDEQNKSNSDVSLEVSA